MSSRYHDLIPQKKSFENQFLITKTQPVYFDYIECLSVNTWNIFLYSDIKHIKLYDLSGCLIGVFLGTLIDYNVSKIIENDMVVDVSLSDDDALESFIYSYGGGFLFVCCYGDNERVYLDAGGVRSLVFDANIKQAASTTGLMLNDAEYSRRFDAELFDALDVPDVSMEGWFTAGLTAHHGVERLLCNHYLDMKTWSVHRHWPKHNIVVAQSTSDHAVRIAEIVKGSVHAMVNSGSTICALTGGTETRFILAACRPLIDSLAFFTVNGLDSAKDIYLARKISQAFHLNHRQLRTVMATKEEQNIWLYRSSHSVGCSNMLTYPTLRQTKEFKYLVGGTGGEIGRAFFWRPTDSEHMHLSAKDIVSRCGMPNHPRLIEVISTWLQSVSGFNSFIQLDIAYMELRVSSWAFAQTYAAADKNKMHPMLCRETCQLMLELSPAAKRESAYITEGIKALWPELDEFPVNKYGDYRDVLAILGKVSDPKKVVRKLRKTLRW